MTPQSGSETPANSDDRRGTTSETATGSTNRALVYFAKAPIPGQVKTRLCPPLTPHEAAGLYSGFLRDLFRRAVDAATSQRWTPVVYGLMPDGRAAGLEFVSLRELVPDGLALRAQRGADLWGRLRAAFREQFDAGMEQVAVRNTDSPDLPEAAVAAAFAAVKPGKLVLGPDQGGGYWIVALAAPCDDVVLHGLFHGLPEGTDSVLADTNERAERLGLEVELVSMQGDVDRFADLLAMWQSRAPSAFKGCNFDK